jgi:hypothetical protein
LANGVIRNNLRAPVKPSNLERYKYGDDESNASSRAGTYSIQYLTDKNVNADSTNPNIYHSIDEVTKDHVYDEIKQKESYVNLGEFGNKILFLFVNDLQFWTLFFCAKTKEKEKNLNMK